MSSDVIEERNVKGIKKGKQNAIRGEISSLPTKFKRNHQSNSGCKYNGQNVG
jgi:hypothetical protein